jgi:CubicO group peptidase (beta-lactamase class C family)
VIHYGAIVTEWGDPAKRTELYSVRKNLLSALIGIAVAQGKMSVESTLAQLAIEDNSPSPTDLEKQATVRMLLKARSGVYHAALYETPEMAAQRPARGRWCRRTGCAKARAPIPRPGAVEAMAICGGLPATRKARFRKEVSLR